MLNPYANVDFANALRVPSFTHAHVTTQGVLNNTCNNGYKFLPISNYYPSEPFDPTGYTVPSDVIISPNAEHHNFTFAQYTTDLVHLNSLGSTFSSGSPSGQTPKGYGGGFWTDFVDQALAALKYADGGGITINHPTWTRDYKGLDFPDWMIGDMLDYDDRILGIEILNAGAARHGSGIEYCIASWDNILKSGRKCWGFCTPDWYVSENMSYPNGPGYCMLLVDEFTEEKCLKAFRNGAFFGKEANTSLGFDSISVSGQTVTATASGATTISAIIDGTRTDYSATTATVTVPDTAVYIRFEATSADNKIYSNAITFREGKRSLKTKKPDDMLLFYC